MIAHILRAGFLSSVQDAGRVGHLASGVSLGGALDSHALAVANVLVGNEPDFAGIEVTLGQMRIKFEEQRLVAWAGGAFSVRTAESEISAGRPALIGGGEELLITAPERGGRAWLAIAGGVDVPFVLGSRATDLRNHFGGFAGRALQDGDRLSLGSSTPVAETIAARLGERHLASWRAPWDWASTRPLHPFLRFVRGAEWSLFKETSHVAMERESFTVGPETDRMGVRLQGPPLARLTTSEMISAAVVPGTLQVPPSGQPILLLGDCQTIGGYPKIAHVITVDLPAAVQLQPGDAVRFAEVSLAEAQRMAMERARDFRRFRIGLEMQRR